MSNLKKHSTLILMAMLILIIIPISFAADVDQDINSTIQASDAVDEMGINYNEIQSTEELDDESLQASDDSDVLNAGYDYENKITDPSSGTVDYTKGEQVKISMTATFSSMDSLASSDNKMYVFINGATTSNIVLKSTWNTDVQGTAKSFSFYLGQFDDYLDQSTNTLIFHPNENYYEWDGIETYSYQPLTVNIVGGGTTPEPITTYYVDSSISADGDGSEGSNYTTLSAAIAAANTNFGDDGGKIIIKKGTNGIYTESATISITKNMEISSDECVTITSATDGSLFSQSAKANVNLTGLTFKDMQITSGAIYYQNGNEVDGSTLIIQNCNFINNTAPTLVRIYKTYATFKYDNFIGNTLTDTGNGRGGIITYYETGTSQYQSNKYKFDISYSNIVGNTLAQAYFFTSPSYQTLVANNNYWGSNYEVKPTNVYNKESNTDYIALTSWVNLNVAVDSEVEAGSENELTLNFVLNGETSPAENMPEFDVALSADSGSISGNTYTAPGTSGTDTIYAKYGTTTLITKEVTVKSSSLVNANLTVPETLNVYVGDTLNIDATQDGAGDISYESMDISIATVGADGIVRGVKEGKVNITVSVAATDSCLADSKNVTVTVSRKTTEVVCPSNSISIVYDGKLDIGEYADWEPVIKSGDVTIWGNVVFEVIDPSIIYYNDDYYNSYFKGLKVGSTTINASYAGDETYAPSYMIINVEVVPADASVSVDSDSLDLFVGGNANVVATTSPEGLAVKFTSDNVSVVTVDDKGKLFAVGEGTATVTVTINDTNYFDNTTNVIVVVTTPKPYAGIIYVNETGDNNNDGSEQSPVSTIAQAIALATDGEHEAKIIIAEGTYKEHDLIISSDLEIIGQGNVVIDADKQGRIFKITSGDVKLTDLTLTNGVAPADYREWGDMYAYGGALFVSGNIEIDNVKFVNNTATVYGGAIYWNGKSILLNNSEFVNNTAYDSSSYPESTGGGALFLTGDNAEIIKSDFVNNSADYGGAIYIVNKKESAGNIIVNNTFSQNSAEYGGAIRTKTDDYATDNYIDINNNTFVKNIATQDGGAVSNKAYTRVINNIFESNSASVGGAISNYDEIGIRKNTMDSNQASSKGNDVYNEGSILSTLTVTFNNGKTTIIDNGKGTTLTVKVTDDNGNLITGGEVTFKVKDIEVGTVSVVEGVASTDYVPHENGTLKVSGAYSSDYLEVINGTLEVSNAREEYFGIIYVDINGDDENEGSSVYPVKSINQAISLATREGGSNKIIIREGTYKVTGYTFSESINITGDGNPILDAEKNNAIFTLNGNENTNFTFSGLTFANGYAHQVKWGDNEYGGAIYLKGGNLYLYNDKFVNNSGTMGAGAIYIIQGAMDYSTYQNSPANAVITACEFDNNGNGKNYAGAIYVNSNKAKAEIKDSTFAKNTAGSGGAIYVSSASVDIIGCTFNNNNASSEGGAIYISGNANIKNNEFTGNNASGYSSAMYIYKSSWENNVIFEGNTINSANCEIYTNNLDIKGVIINILDGETKTFCEGEIPLYATVVDDNGNKISSSSFTFVINTTEESVALNNGEATTVYNAKLEDDGAVVTTTVTSSADGAEVNPGKLEIIEYNIIFDFDDVTAHAGKTLHVYVEARDSAGNIIKDNLTVSFNGEEFEVKINEDDLFDIELQIPDTPQTLDLKVSYGEFNQTHTVNVVEYYDGVIYVSPEGNDDNNGSENAHVKTIEKAIELASDSDNVAHKIIIAEGTYTENDLTIDSALEIVGQGNVVIDAQQKGRIFNINANTNISGITFKNGKEEDGAAIYIGDAEVIIDNVVFEGNVAENAGGAIYWNGDNGKLTNTVFENNTAKNGIVKLGEYSWNLRRSSGLNTLIENCTFNNNHNTEYGNCIGLDIEEGVSYVTIKNTNFTNNIGEAYSEHGALYIKGDNVEVNNCLFENNSMGMASAMQIDGLDAKVINSKFINNTVVNGLATRSGAIELQGSAEITGCTFINNGGENCVEGGAINIVNNLYYEGDTVISNNEFINNSAKNGAAIFVDGGSEDGMQFNSVTIEKNSFKENIASYGSAVYIENCGDAQVTIQNNDIIATEGTTDAIYVDEDSSYEVNVASNPIQYITTMDIKTNSPSLGENATITVNITEKATGNVTIKVGNNDPITVNITKGGAVLNVPDLAIGEYNVTVTYNGDENYTVITSKTTLTVSKVEITADEALNITAPENTKTPTYSINLPSDAKGNFSVLVDGKVVETKELVNGSASITVPELSSGNHNIIVLYSGDNNYAPIEKNTTVTISAPVVKISGNKNINALYSSSASYKVLITKDGKAVGAGESVIFNFNGKKTIIKTDSKGFATLKINTKVKVKKYTITATYNGVTVKNTVKVNNIIKAANKKVKKSKKVTKVKITLKKVNRKYIKKAKITIKFKGKKYKVKTNKKGVATWKVKKSMLKKLKVGKKYKYTVTYGKDVVTKKLTIKK